MGTAGNPLLWPGHAHSLHAPIEVGESMETVVKRFIGQRLSIEETAERTQHPIEFVRQCLTL